MSNVFQMKRGAKENLPNLLAGELAFTTDEKKLYVGDGTANTCINPDLGTAAVKNTGTAAGDVVEVQADGKIPAAVMPDIKSLDANKLTGTIALERLPHGALERLVVVADDAARLALTTAQVQNGDTVKVTATNKMYFVVDETKLNEEAGFEVYSAGTATAVAWSGITEKPTTLTGFGITDAAPLASPALTGTPTAPTAETTDNSTRIATTAYVKAQGYLTQDSVIDCGTF